MAIKTQFRVVSKKTGEALTEWMDNRDKAVNRAVECVFLESREVNEKNEHHESSRKKANGLNVGRYWLPTLPGELRQAIREEIKKAIMNGSLSLDDIKYDSSFPH